MILKFVVLERNLNEYETYTATDLMRGLVQVPSLNYLVDLVLVSTSNLREPKSYTYDMYYATLLTLNAKKFFYSHNLQRTMYPDQGLAINVFPIFPKLISTSPVTKRYLPVGGLVSLYTSLAAEELAVISILRNALHNIPFLFPYERVEIPMLIPYRSVEAFITLQLFVSGFTLKLKQAS